MSEEPAPPQVKKKPNKVVYGIVAFGLIVLLLIFVLTHVGIFGRWANLGPDSQPVEPGGQLPAVTMEFDINGTGSMSSNQAGEVAVADFDYTLEGQKLTIVVTDAKVEVGGVTQNQQDLTQNPLSTRTQYYNVRVQGNILYLAQTGSDGQIGDDPGQAYQRM
jgi:hypothetical protein